jgi:cytidyltransferase-like protein
MGGAAGHMNHPFDLEWVNSGSDLLDFFNKAKAFIEEARGGSVKIDGVNVSFKVVETPNGHEFAVDRGSMKEIDISGITVDRFEERFPPGHGMRRFVAQLLTILNAAIGEVESELKALGMWSDPSVFLNTEYVEGTTNVTQYDENFLAIHGLNQFYQRTAKSGPSKGNIRSGAERPEIWDEKKQKEVPIKDPSREVSYDPAVMASLIEKLRPYGEEYGFQIYGDVPTEMMVDTEVDYTGALSEPLAIKISDDQKIIKSLGEWLQEAVNPRYRAIKLKNGTVKHPLHKDIYKMLSSGDVSVIDLVEEQYAQDAIYGTVFMHAARMLGNEILKALTSPMGDVINHEGVVLRDSEAFGTEKPVKITGEFIVGGTASDFQKEAPIIMKEENEDEDPVIDIEFEDEPLQGETVAIVPGAFKPPHMGHVNMVEKYAQNADRVVILISAPTKSGRKLPNGREITAEDSEKIWNLFVGSNPKIEIYKSSHASPINAAYEVIGKGGLREKVAEKMGMDPISGGDTVILGASNKGGDASRWAGAEKYVGDDLNLVPPMESAVEPLARPNGEPFSATDMRNLLGDILANKEALRDFAGENVDDVLRILGMEALEEMSSMAGGSVEGAVGARGGPWKTIDVEKENEEEKERSELNIKNSLATAKGVLPENIDLTLADEVMRLIMERGILR